MPAGTAGGDRRNHSWASRSCLHSATRCQVMLPTAECGIVDETQAEARAYDAVCTTEFFGFNAALAAVSGVGSLRAAMDRQSGSRARSRSSGVIR